MTYSSGALHHLLRNPVYCGLIRHKETVYPGQHEAIIPDAIWRAAQAIADDRRTNAVKREHHKNPLLGLLSDDSGRRYSAVHTTKGGRRYRYYVSRDNATLNARKDNPPSARVPANALEEHVLQRLHQFLRAPGDVMDAAAHPDDDARGRRRLTQAAEKLAEGTLASLRSLVHAVRVSPSSITIAVDRAQLRIRCGLPAVDVWEGATSQPTIPLPLAVRLYKTGHELRLVMTNPAGRPVASRQDAKLLKLVSRGRDWYEDLTSGRVTSIRDIARRENLPDAYVSRVLQGSLLAPSIVEHILRGTQPVTLTVESLRTAPPLDWSEQCRQFGIDVGQPA